MKKFIYIFIILLLANCKNPKVTENLVVQKTEKDSTNKSKQKYNKTEIIYKKQDTLIKTSEPFIINNIKCYWKLTFIVYEGNEYGEGILELKNKNKTLLNNSRNLSSNDSYYQHNFSNFHFESFTIDSKEDLNFDGFKDFKIFDKEPSGSAGMFYWAYIFNPKKKVFELNKELSGYELEVNKVEKTLSSYAKNGFGYNVNSIIHFDKIGKIKYTELIEREIIDTTNFVKTTYKKLINNKVVKTKTETTKFEGW